MWVSHKYARVFEMHVCLLKQVWDYRLLWTAWYVISCENEWTRWQHATTGCQKKPRATKASSPSEQEHIWTSLSLTSERESCTVYMSPAIWNIWNINLEKYASIINKTDNKSLKKIVKSSEKGCQVQEKNNNRKYSL